MTLPPLCLWRGTLLALALALAAGALLAASIGSGWNDRRPARPPLMQQEGPLLLQVTQPETQAIYLLPAPTGAFTLETTALPLQDVPRSSYGLVFDCRADRYGVLAIDTDGYVAVLRIEGSQENPVVDWQLFPHVRRGQAANRLRLACAGDACHGWVNDEHAVVFAWEGAGGEIGLWGRRLAGERAAFAFEGLVIWSE